MTEQEMEELLLRGHEVTGVEFKAAGSRTSNVLWSKVLRALMGMANLQDGGLVIIGVSDNGNSLTPTGLTTDDLATWQYDHIATQLSLHADPSIEFEREVFDFRGKKLLILYVREFTEIPILCKKPLTVDGRVELREGACYVRSKRKPETAEVSNHEDMRALLELANAKLLRKWVAQAQSAGLIGTPPPPSESDREMFLQQLGEL
jgi:predicted HTH transcriptional regulator